jgi:hypothetical protein
VRGKTRIKAIEDMSPTLQLMNRFSRRKNVELCERMRDQCSLDLEMRYTLYQRESSTDEETQKVFIGLSFSEAVFRFQSFPF